MRYLKTIMVFLALISILAGCGQASTTTPVTTETPAATMGTQEATATAAAVDGTASAAPVLELVGQDGTSKSLTMDELKALPAIEGWAGIKSSTGKITPPVKIKGVAIEELCNMVGGITSQTGVSIEAKDGYAMTFSSDQILNGAYIAYDPATGDEVTPSSKLQSIIAYEADGKPIPSDGEGPLRLAVVSDKNDQVVDGHWAVKWVTKIALKSLASEWSVMLHGTVKENLDRGSFESCSAPNCHGAKWTDDKGQVWSGNPLWLFAGAVDDDKKHGTRAFSDSLADTGYKVEIIAADGYSVTLDSAMIKRNDKIIVANKMNDNPLDEKSFPLQLVGPDLSKKEMVSNIAEIKLDLGGAEGTPTVAATETATAETSATASTNGPALTVGGAVDNELSLSIDDFKALGVVQITATHPKKGDQEYQGVRLSTVLEKAKPKAEATKLVLTASDGYTAELALADVQGCANCLLAIGDDGKLSTVMPDMEGTFWVKDITQIKLK